jgi:AsmA protein
LKANGQGTLDFASQAVDYRLQTNVYRIPEEGAGAEMQDLKAAQIPVRVSGTLADPKVRLDLDAVAKAQAAKKVDEKKEEMTNKLKEKLGQWFGVKKH